MGFAAAAAATAALARTLTAGEGGQKCGGHRRNRRETEQQTADRYLQTAVCEGSRQPISGGVRGPGWEDIPFDLAAFARPGGRTAVSDPILCRGAPSATHQQPFLLLRLGSGPPIFLGRGMERECGAREGIGESSKKAGEGERRWLSRGWSDAAGHWQIGERRESNAGRGAAEG